MSTNKRLKHGNTIEMLAKDQSIQDLIKIIGFKDFEDMIGKGFSKRTLINNNTLQQWNDKDLKTKLGKIFQQTYIRYLGPSYKITNDMDIINILKHIVKIMGYNMISRKSYIPVTKTYEQKYYVFKNGE